MVPTEKSRPTFLVSLVSPVAALNIVFLHSHFEHGGVTQVVGNQVRAIEGDFSGKLFVASGGRNGGLKQTTRDQVTALTIESLEYDSLVRPEIGPSATRQRANQIANDLVEVFERHGINPHDSILHWHNHSLGKNVAVPGAIQRLSQEHGYQQLLQIHDFAEDFRPENLQRLIESFESNDAHAPDTFNAYCYPTNERISYATLTQADRKVLSRLGIQEKCSHVLPNAVSLGDAKEPDREAALAKIRSAAGLPNGARWCVYPVRGIRRKNLGEFLLLSRLCGDDMYAGLTLPPTTEIERQSYERWREVARRVAPRAVFDAGTFENVSFQENLAASTYIISTSVAEGFGMAYLEPWLASRSVIARRLSNVTDDFAEAGVNLEQFYDQIQIPGTEDWVSACWHESNEMFDRSWSSLPESLRPVQTRGDHSSRTVIDFAALVPSRQIEVLERMKADQGFESAIEQANLDLVNWLSEPPDPETIEQNRLLIASKYSLNQTGSQLRALYARISNASTSVALQEGSPATESALSIICGERPFFPSRTETNITT